jgi:hypothetical protein
MPGLDIDRMRRAAKVEGRYEEQLARLQKEKRSTECIEPTVRDVMRNIEEIASTTNAGRTSLVVYGEPQSGKTEMMICLTAKLLDEGFHTIIHLMNDSVDLLGQNLGRFQESGLSPLPISSTELLLQKEIDAARPLVVFCKKNGSNMEALRTVVGDRPRRVVIDDEADYATPNSQVNKSTPTPINTHVTALVGDDGCYLGVTATPARLDLNNTLDNEAERWVPFKPHKAYTGPKTFFPIDRATVPYRLRLLQGAGDDKSTQDAVVRFLATSAHLNGAGAMAANYSMLVHTSGRKDQHQADREAVELVTTALGDSVHPEFVTMTQRLFDAAAELYPDTDPNDIVEYVVHRADRIKLIVLNSKRDRSDLGADATTPRTPFTIIIGGNIVSRGVTFPNLLSMLFTRDVKTKLQQDTYIQRARMFGARGSYLEHFELTIPSALYLDWHRCFVFHELAFATVGAGIGSPVWISDGRINVTASASVDRSTVSVAAGEMSFRIFDYDDRIANLIAELGSSVETLRAIHQLVGDEAMPSFLISYIERVGRGQSGALAIYPPRRVFNYRGKFPTDHENIARAGNKGFFGSGQLRHPDVPNPTHHINILWNDGGKARIFYKYEGSLTFVQNLRWAPQPPPETDAEAA